MRASIRWVVVVLAGLEAGWMAFDGARALMVGDYVTPQSGDFAGQLGPWAVLVSAIGIDPRSTAMKLVFVTYGLAWLMVAGAFVRQVSWARKGMVAAAMGSLWYLVPGTVLSVLQLGLLLVPGLSVRRAASPSTGER